MKKLFKGLFVALCAAITVVGASCGKGETEVDWYYKKTEMKTDGQLYTQSQIELPQSLWETPESERCDTWDRGAAKGYYIKSVQGTWVFCLVGFPATATEENKVPAMVLIHGGAGTAYQQWVNFWVNRGYAAIAMDTEGNVPNEGTAMNNGNRSRSTKTPIGPINEGFTDINKPIEQQWGYHAIAAVVAANSFLRSFPQVDKDRVGVTGISYGSLLTWQVMAYDDRYLFGAPVYGSPCQQGHDTRWGTLMQGKVGEYWDDITIIKDNPTPILYFNSNIDGGFSVEATTDACNLKENSYMTFRHGFLHGHDLGGLQVDEVYAFADYFCLGKPGLIKFKMQPSGFEPEVEFEVPKGVKAVSAWVYYATTDVLNDKTVWTFLDADLVGSKATASLPGNAVSYYFNIIDDRGLEVSSNVVYTTAEE